MKMGVTFSNAAANEIQEDVFGIEEHQYAVRPDDTVWNKLLRNKGTVTEVEPSETGFVRVRYDTGEEMSVEKEEFHQQFVVV